MQKEREKVFEKKHKIYFQDILLILKDISCPVVCDIALFNVASSHKVVYKYTHTCILTLSDASEKYGLFLFYCIYRFVVMS